MTQVNGVDVAPVRPDAGQRFGGVQPGREPGLRPTVVAGIGDECCRTSCHAVRGQARATKVEVVIDNQLQALSQATAWHSLTRRVFRIEIDEAVIPEPTTLLLLLGGCLGLAAVRDARSADARALI